jgi:hypothetical protein
VSIPPRAVSTANSKRQRILQTVVPKPASGQLKHAP